jgi:glycosyltransferase involved in cell wall biosynthesis
MRIAHVSDVYLPRLGGIELQIHDLVARQRLRGHDPMVLTATPGAESALRLNVARPGIGAYRLVPDRVVERWLRERTIDVVHAHVSAFSPLAWAAARAAARLGVPAVVSVHSMWDDIVPLLRRYARWQGAAQWPVVWAAVSTAAAVAVRQVLDGSPVVVLPNGIDPGAWLVPVARSGGDIPTLVAVMRMVRRKRPGALVRLLLALHTTHPGRFRAVLAGDGPVLPGLRRDVSAAGADAAIRLTGALDRSAIKALLATADLFLAPASLESFGIAALEARSAGLPVVARAKTGVADFIEHGVEGWLAQSDDDFHVIVAGLLDEPGRMTTVARHNRAVAPKITWDAVLDAADELYDTAAQRHVRGPRLRLARA